MIYLKNNTEKQDCFIPKNGDYDGRKTYKEGVEWQKSLIEPITITENGVYENENGFSPISVSVVGGDARLINKDIVIEEEHITLNATDDGADGYRSVNVDASVLANRKFEEGFEQGRNECPDCEDLTELIVRENGVYEGAFNRVDVNVEDTDGSYDDGYNKGYQDGQANCEGGGDCNLEDKWITPSMGETDGNGLIVTQPSDGFDGMSRVVIDPSTIYNEGVEQGRNEGGGDCPEPTYINPIIVSDGSGKINGDEGVEVPHFVYGGNTHYEVQGITPSESTLFIKTSIECFGVDYENLSEPINVIGAENADWNETTFGLRIWSNSFNFKIGSWEKNIPFSYGWHDIEMGYNAEKSWVAVDGEYVFSTDEGENLSYTDRADRQIMIGAINSENGAFRPFYGNIGVTYIECTSGKIYLVPTGGGKMLEYVNDFNSPYTTLEGQGSYDVRMVYGNIKTFTWLGDGNNNSPSYMDLEATENRVYSPSEYGVDYFRNVNVNVPQPSLTELKVTENGVYEGAYNKVNVNIPTIKEQIKDYYYCPLIVSDGSFGEAAKSWNENDVALNNYSGDITTDILYLPTFGNRNEWRTKEKISSVQKINVPAGDIGSIEFGDDVKIYNNITDEHYYTNLTKIVLGDSMEYLHFSKNDRFPTLTEIWDYSTAQKFELHLGLAYFFKSGTIYLKSQSHETEWMKNLPEDWTIIYI